MRELRLVLLSGLFALPLAWSALYVTETRADLINHVLSVILLGTLPLLALMLFSGADLSGADADVRYGQNRHVFLSQALLRSLIALLVFALTGCWLALFVLRGFKDPLLISDLLATTPIAFSASVCMASSFAAVRAWLGRLGLGFLIVLFWWVGSLNLPIAALVPTGHVRYLLGVGSELPLPLWASFICLYAMAGAALGALYARVPR